ncbi:MAG: hypothetical protein WDW38_000062 [Sanguina aurantia]
MNGGGARGGGRGGRFDARGGGRGGRAVGGGRGGKGEQQWQQPAQPFQGTNMSRPAPQQNAKPWSNPAPRQPSLLEKLLTKEVRCDRSRLLQAARFFVRNGFLQGGVPSDSLRYPDESSGSFGAAAVLPPLEDVLREAAAAEAELDADMGAAGAVTLQQEPNSNVESFGEESAAAVDGSPEGEEEESLCAVDDEAQGGDGGAEDGGGMDE